MKSSPGRDRLIPAGLIALSLVPSIAGINRFQEVMDGAPVTRANARFLWRQYPCCSTFSPSSRSASLGRFNLPRSSVVGSVAGTAPLGEPSLQWGLPPR
jgi:hypothetical protein